MNTCKHNDIQIQKWVILVFSLLIKQKASDGIENIANTWNSISESAETRGRSQDMLLNHSLPGKTGCQNMHLLVRCPIQCGRQRLYFDPLHKKKKKQLRPPDITFLCYSKVKEIYLAFYERKQSKVL